MIRHFIAATLFICPTALCPSFSEARQPAQLMAGEPAGPNVTFSFGGKGSAEGLRIETHQIGNPGAKLSNWVDGSRERLFSHILTADECKFGDDGARCQLIFPPQQSELFAFSRRLQARQNGPRRGPERGRNAVEHERVVGWLYPNVWIGI